MSTNVIYTSIPQVLASCTSLNQQRALVELILMNMLTAINAAALSGQFEEYKLDTGETKTEVRYSRLADLQRAYDGMLKTYQSLNNMLTFLSQGRQYRLVDGRNFPGRGFYGRF